MSEHFSYYLLPRQLWYFRLFIIIIWHFDYTLVIYYFLFIFFYNVISKASSLVYAIQKKYYTVAHYRPCATEERITKLLVIKNIYFKWRAKKVFFFRVSHHRVLCYYTLYRIFLFCLIKYYEFIIESHPIPTHQTLYI